MEDDGAHLVSRRQVDGGHGSDALPVEDDVLGTDSVPGSQGVPRRVDVGVQILLGRLARAHAVARVVVAEDVAVDARPEAEVEAAHLPQVDGVAVAEEERESGAGAAADEHAGDPVAARSPRLEHLDGLEFALRVLPLGALAQVQRVLGTRLVGHERVRRLRRKERQLGRDPRWARRTAEQAAQLA